MNIYVSGKYDTPEVMGLIAALKDSQHDVTCDWTEFTIAKPYLEHEENAEYAIEMIEGVHHCELFILIGADNFYGAMVEFGAALALDTDCWLVHNDCRETVFFTHPLVELKSIEQVYKDLGLHDYA